jgi:hypothetical protein
MVIARGGRAMTAQPIPEYLDDPVETLRILPNEYHIQFLTEYDHAVDRARRPEGFRALQELLRLWRLRAVAYSRPGYPERLAAADGRSGDFAPATRVVPGWSAE